MNFIYFICPEVPQYAKYCEAFFNYLTYGYKTWSRDRYISTTTKEKRARSRLPKNSNLPAIEEMKAGDIVMDRIYQKVITADCYMHYYSRYDDLDDEVEKDVIYITSNKKPKSIPRYLNNTPLTVWKVSNINNITNKKFDLFESLIRNVINDMNK